ncbi:MAG: hypothetical protein LBH50_06060 [Spirochaetaceae bacterium]|jgi:hypothetical protein|nr:hypothetical protein [Spirochaetaceae bacterium]
MAFCLFALCGAILLYGCKRSSLQNEIVIPVTRPLSRSTIGYGVVNANYTRILDERGDEGKSLGFLRKGSIVEILERRPVVKDDKAETWVLAYGSYKGWVKENELRVYPSMAQAVTASENMPQ